MKNCTAVQALVGWKGGLARNVKVLGWKMGHLTAGVFWATKNSERGSPLDFEFSPFFETAKATFRVNKAELILGR